MIHSPVGAARLVLPVADAAPYVASHEPARHRAASAPPGHRDHRLLAATGMVLVLLGLAALTVAQAVHFDGQIDRAVRLVPDADPDEVTGERQGNVAMAVIFGVPAVLLAVWLAVTAAPVRRGGNVARILVFVASGAQLLVCVAQCCSGGFLVPLLAMPEIAAEPPPDWDEEWETSTFLDTLYAGTDPWDDLFFPVAALGVLTVLALSAAWSCCWRCRRRTAGSCRVPRTRPCPARPG